jgi:hypothetical protein
MRHPNTLPPRWIWQFLDEDEVTRRSVDSNADAELLSFQAECHKER